MEQKKADTKLQDTEQQMKDWGIQPYTIEEIGIYKTESPAPFRPEVIFDSDVKQQHLHQSILDNLGSRGVQNIINDPTPFPDYVYRPNPDHFVTEVLEESKIPRLVKGGKKRRTR